MSIKIKNSKHFTFLCVFKKENENHDMVEDLTANDWIPRWINRTNKKALKAIRDAIKLNPQNINLKQILLRELLPTEKKPIFSKETKKLVNDILVLEPNNVDGLFFSGFAAYNKGEKKKAVTYWDLLLKQLPKDSLMSKEINKRIKLLQD